MTNRSELKSLDFGAPRAGCRLEWQLGFLRGFLLSMTKRTFATASSHDLRSNLDQLLANSANVGLWLKAAVRTAPEQGGSTFEI